MGYPVGLSSPEDCLTCMSAASFPAVVAHNRAIKEDGVHAGYYWTRLVNKYLLGLGNGRFTKAIHSLQQDLQLEATSWEKSIHFAALFERYH